MEMFFLVRGIFIFLDAIFGSEKQIWLVDRLNM